MIMSQYWFLLSTDRLIYLSFQENLKRRVNDLLSKNRMVAFLVLDKDPENSIEVLPVSRLPST